MLLTRALMEWLSTMKDKKLSKAIEKAILIAQGNEITEHFVY